AGISGIVHDIDSWLAGQLPNTRCGPVKGTESLGSVVARLAEAQVVACWELTRLPAGDDRVHRAWVQLAELRDGYDDLVPVVASGRIDLPRSWRGIDDAEREFNDPDYRNRARRERR
ncbi:DUF4254 domain-containing protein, partial [Nocardia cyriacigeorgica]|nr:DUF4254 domain-containing protein [Nocardia cyriacigeorgica]